MISKINYSNNVLKIEGFKNKAQLNSFINKSKNTTELLSFENLFPFPDKIVGEYELTKWKIENWGISKDVCNVKLKIIGNKIYYHFNSDQGYLMHFIDSLSELYKQLTFTLTYINSSMLDEMWGPSGGVYQVKNNEVIIFDGLFKSESTYKYIEGIIYESCSTFKEVINKTQYYKNTNEDEKYWENGKKWFFESQFLRNHFIDAMIMFNEEMIPYLKYESKKYKVRKLGDIIEERMLELHKTNEMFRDFIEKVVQRILKIDPKSRFKK